MEAQPSFILGTHEGWKTALDRLQPLDLPLLAIGAGEKRKAPADPATGRPLNGWQTAAHAIEQIKAAHPQVIAAGTRTGADAGGLLAFDVDGATALSWLLEHGCDPEQTTTWQIHRNTDSARLKVLFRLSPEQQQQLGQIRTKANTGTGEAVELFHGNGQVIVIGDHPSSGGHYYWPDHLGPEALVAIPECWWNAALSIALQQTPLPKTNSRTRKGSWRELKPCPICGRDSGWCAQHEDGRTIRCFQGSTYSPPLGLKPGEEINRQGTVWAFSREQQQSDGHVFSIFVTPDLERRASTSSSNNTASGNGQEHLPQKPITFEDQWQALEDHASELACEPWPVMKAIASLSRKASELDIPRLGQRQLEQLLEHGQRRVRAKAKPVEPGGSFTIKATPWTVEGIFRHGLNLLVGQSGAGKSRLAAACMAAWLRGDETWIGRPLSGDDPRHRYALIIGTDQSLEDWHLTLGPVGLTRKISTTEVVVHDRLTLYGLEAGQQLDADGLSVIRRWVDAHPGGMVLIDSLSACLPPGIDEDKSSAARPVHQLQEVLGDAWAILTHHTRKGAGKEGNLGVGAGRGSGAIDAAVSRVVGLGLIHKMENGQMVAQESDPRRELISTKRGGKTQHLIVSSDATGFWDVHGTAEELKAQERQQRALAGLTEPQTDALDAVEAADGWITTRDVVKALLPLGEEYDSTSSKAALVRKSLKRLEVLGLVETQRVGNDRSYRAPEPVEQREVEGKGSTGSTVMNTGISLVQPKVQPSSTQPVEPPESVVDPVDPPVSHVEPEVEPAKSQSLQGLNQLNHLFCSPLPSAGSTGVTGVTPPPHPDLLLPDEATIQQLVDLSCADEAALPATLALQLDPYGNKGITGAKVKSWLERIDFADYLF